MINHIAFEYRYFPTEISIYFVGKTVGLQAGAARSVQARESRFAQDVECSCRRMRVRAGRPAGVDAACHSEPSLTPMSSFLSGMHLLPHSTTRFISPVCPHLLLSVLQLSPPSVYHPFLYPSILSPHPWLYGHFPFIFPSGGYNTYRLAGSSFTRHYHQ